MAQVDVGGGLALGNTYLLERGGTDKTTEGGGRPQNVYTTWESTPCWILPSSLTPSKR